MRRLISATLLLYPRAVRRGHGAELHSLVEELIEREGAPRHRVMSRLALDGLTQRLTARATLLALAGTLAMTSAGGLIVSDFAAASARGAVPVHTRVLSPVRPRVIPHRTRPQGRRQQPLPASNRGATTRFRPLAWDTPLK